jgi:hypothetical protein
MVAEQLRPVAENVGVFPKTSSPEVEIERKFESMLGMLGCLVAVQVILSSAPRSSGCRGRLLLLLSALLAFLSHLSYRPFAFVLLPASDLTACVLMTSAPLL